ncbi:hypothetical protein GGI35DRAFT_96677 [Trichoderma velutinum]
MQLRLLACSFFFWCPLPHQLSSVGDSVEKPLPRTSSPANPAPGSRGRGRIENSTESLRDCLPGSVFAQTRVPANPIPPRAEQQSEGDGIEKAEKGLLLDSVRHASLTWLPAADYRTPKTAGRPAISSSRLIGSARFNTKCPIQKALFSSVLLLLPLGVFWEPRDGQQNTDPLSWFFSTEPYSLLRTTLRST